jgi:hypothetical protein
VVAVALVAELEKRLERAALAAAVMEQQEALRPLAQPILVAVEAAQVKMALIALAVPVVLAL